MGLEERFDIEVPEEDLEDVTTVGQARRPRDHQGRLVAPFGKGIVGTS